MEDGEKGRTLSANAQNEFQQKTAETLQLSLSQRRRNHSVPEKLVSSLCRDGITDVGETVWLYNTKNISIDRDGLDKANRITSSSKAPNISSDATIGFLKRSTTSQIAELAATAAASSSTMSILQATIYNSSYNTTSESVLKPFVKSSSNNKDCGNVITTGSNRMDPGIITKQEANISSGSNNRDPRASPKQDDLRLSGPPSGQGAGGGTRTRDRGVPADLRADSLATVPPTPPQNALNNSFDPSA
ncbi:hypothetical protein PoB_003366000 [Plakobranchus ocellatus]|uniref:Uncharacterized protein n=1 Tax=Plakobranchus ocellatus TaxID=259542 RepID=A0AAV4AJY9_9GAST|nr:hypothetical protein PoB_003366000 [Plakobranchus ocellatus]